MKRCFPGSGGGHDACHVQPDETMGLIDGGEVTLHQRAIGDAFAVQRLLYLTRLAVMVDMFHRLLEPNGNEQADDNGGDVDEEVSPGGGGVVGGVNVEHGWNLSEDGWRFSLCSTPPMPQETRHGWATRHRGCGQPANSKPEWIPFQRPESV